MRHYFFIVILSLASSIALANPVLPTTKGMMQPDSPNVITQKFSRLKSELNLRKDQKRSTEFPTHIVRLKMNDLSDSNLSCDELFDKTNKLLKYKFWKKDITFEILGMCTDDRNTNQAHSYELSTYFDPQTDDAINYLQQYIAEYNGSDFYGTPFKIEPVNGIVLSLGIETGMKTETEMSVLYSLHNKLYFNSMFQISDTLFSDIDNKLRINNKDLNTEFLKRWMGAEEFMVQNFIEELSQSNYISIAPDLTFLMTEEPKAYTPLEFYFLGHFNPHIDCTEYDSERCLG